MSTPKNLYGTSNSPIMYKDSVILVHDSRDGNSFIIALDNETGNEKWKTNRNLVAGSWSTPMIWQQNGSMNFQ